MWLVASLAFPLGHDQGYFMWRGEVIAQGGAPYRDAWGMTGPLYTWVFALCCLAFGYVEWAARPLELLLLLAAGRALWRLGQRLGGPDEGRWATLFFLLWYAAGGNWETLQPDAWVGISLLLWFDHVWALPPEAVWRERLVSALALTWVFGCKPPLAVVGVLHPLYRWLVRGDSLVAAVRAGAVVLGGLLVGIAATLGAIHMADGLQAMREIYTQVIPRIYVPNWPSSWAFRLRRNWLVLVLNPRFGGACLAAAGAAMRALARRERAELFVVTWWLVTFGCVWAQGKFFLYHYTILYAPTALLAARGFGALRGGEDAGPLRRRLAHGALAVSLGISALLPGIQAIQGLRYLTGAIDDAAWVGVFDKHFNFDLGAQHEVARWVRERARPEDRLFYWGNDLVVNVASGRPSVGPYGSAYLLFQTFDTTVRDQARERFWKAFQATPPRFVVVADGDDDGRLQPTPSRDLLPDFPLLWEALQRDYTPVREVGTLEVYERR
jgi:hypothetical protein